MMTKVTYWLATAVMLFLMGWSFVLYHLMHEDIAGVFVELGYPAYIVYPLAWAKLVAAIVVITNRYDDLKQMAYAAYFINMLLATAAHLSVGHTPWHAYAGLIVVPLSYFLSEQVRGRPAKRFFSRRG